jgi:2-methylaconitate cis-trans-isomerase PrpF
MPTEQIAYSCTVMRGGTSRALFFQEKDLPPKGPERDYVLVRAMGKPSKLEIDGLGGGQLGTSKIAIIGPPSIPDADIDYTFVQVLIDQDGLDYTSNCGNISSAVAPYAIDAGLVKAVEPETIVRIYNTNSQQVLIARVPVVDGKSKVKGKYVMAGIPGVGAEITLDFSNTVGAKTGRLLPTGKVVEEIRLEEGTTVRVSICDAANPGVFIKAQDIGLRGTELPLEIECTKVVLKRAAEIKNKAAVRIGLAQDWKKVDPTMLVPFVAVVAEPADYLTSDGNLITVSEMDLVARLIILNTCHPAYAGTGAICTAACAALPGSIPNLLLRSKGDIVRIAHPEGIMPVKATLRKSKSTCHYKFDFLGFSRTARKIMDGQVYVPTPD